jgi:hypothetical protein
VLVAVVRVVKTLFVIYTSHAGAVEASVARASERSLRICTLGIRMTVVQIQGALIDVYAKNSARTALVLIQKVGGWPVSQQSLLLVGATALCTF